MSQRDFLSPMLAFVLSLMATPGYGMPEKWMVLERWTGGRVVALLGFNKDITKNDQVFIDATEAACEGESPCDVYIWLSTVGAPLGSGKPSAETLARSPALYHRTADGIEVTRNDYTSPPPTTRQPLLVELPRARVTITIGEPDLDQIAASFRPSDLRQSFKRLSVSPKGEFETSEAYSDRLGKLAGEWLMFAATYTSAAAESNRLGEETTLLVDYDADAQAFRIRIPIDPYVSTGGLDSLSGFDVRAAKSKPTFYTGTTAFGVKSRVQQSTVTYWGLAFSPKSTSYQNEVSLALPAMKARAVKANLRFLVVCHTAALPSGLTLKTQDHHSPGFDHPFDITIDHHYIFIDFMNLWAYDRSTGEILAKIPVVQNAG